MQYFTFWATGEDLDEVSKRLDAQITDALSKGWTPQGGVSIATSVTDSPTGGYYRTYCLAQAVVHT
ncbi:DUF1737 domain-containing protein [Candidatus Saccharibacteria bacterium]|nr:DUF1737 domain-containing protein [Candidatus Saccharibacteria bacterium]